MEAERDKVNLIWKEIGVLTEDGGKLDQLASVDAA